MSDCRKCKNAETCAVDEDCGLFVKKPMTNADSIRVMTDEELAEWIVHKTEGNGFDGYEEVVSAWLDWLKQEVDNATD